MRGKLSRASISTSVIEKVARKEGVDPVELTPCLYDVIDPDALDALFSNSTAGHGEVTFDYAGYNITVESDGRIHVLRKPLVQK